MTTYAVQEQPDPHVVFSTNSRHGYPLVRIGVDDWHRPDMGIS